MYQIKTSRFHSYQGLHEILPNGEALNEFIKHIANLIEKNEFELENISTDIKKEIKILDTFFSDTIDPNQEDNKNKKDDSKNLRLLFSAALDKGYEIQILVLNPYSNAAEERVKTLQDLTPVQEINKSLYRIRQSIFSYSDGFSEEERKEKWSKGGFIAQQIQEIKKYNGKIDIKFYNQLTEMPVYIIGDILLKGLLTSFGTAANNPWLVFVNDKSHNNDTYDYLYKNFNHIWADETTNATSFQLKNGKDLDNNKFR